MSRFSNSRHPGEGRDPVFDVDVDENFTDWTPAFAGVTTCFFT